MCAENKKNKDSLLYSVLTNRCPRCHQGNLFTDANPYHLKHNMDMPAECPVCGQKYELQTGFYFGTGYVSYGVSVFLSGISFALWWLTIGISIKDNSIFWWLGANAVLLVLVQPVVQRLSRSIWIAFFVPYDKNWRDHEPVSL